MSLFSASADGPWAEPLSAGMVCLHGFAKQQAEAIYAALPALLGQAPWRQMCTPGGLPMSVRNSSCGTWGWVSDRQGYRYVEQDPLSGQAWPAMPETWLLLAQQAASLAEFADFVPDSCLLNCYVPGAKMGLHQDKDEQDLSAPIVSLSLGLPAVFLWGGWQRSQRVSQVALHHGDVLVWGGPDRLRFHGVQALAEGEHPLCGRQRINLTFRRARY